jgi:hypothetical protein
MKARIKSMKGYKAFNKGLKCHNFQYKEGKEFTHDGELQLCKTGFHFCENPLDVLNYYDLCDSEFTEVEAIGNVVDNTDGDTKKVTDKIKIGVKLSFPAFIKASFDFLWEKCSKDNKASGDSIQLAASGYYSKLAASGDSSQLAASGYYSKLAASGDSSQLAASGDSIQLAASGYSSKLAASGDYSKLAASGYSSQLAASGDSSQLAASGDSSQLAASGYYSKLAASGYYSKLAASGYYIKLEMTGKDSVGANIGVNSTAKGIKGCWITLAEWRWSNKEGRYIPKCVKSMQIDGEILKENTWYKLENGDFKESKIEG